MTVLNSISSEVVRPIRKNNKTIGYVVKDVLGNNKNMPTLEIKKYIKSGNKIKGLKLTSDDRLIIDKSYGKIGSSTSSAISALKGKGLIGISQSRVGRYNARFYVGDIVKFALNDEYDRLFIIHGIRRTGKTVSMLHSILELYKYGIDSDRLYYININNSNATFKDLVETLNNIKDAIVFIDEITFIPELISKINYLVDILSSKNHIKIIVAGTDSYVFPISQMSSLFGRAHVAHSTYISYREYISVLGLSPSELSYAKYIKDGTLYGNEYSGITNMQNKIIGAIIKNIENTVNRNRQFVASDTIYCDMLKYSPNDMLFLIYNILISATLPKSLNSLNDITKPIGKEKIQFLASAFGVDSADITARLSGVTNDSIRSMVKALEELGIVNRICNLANFVISDADTLIGYRDVTNQELCVNIPGLLDTLLSILKMSYSNIVGTENEDVILANLCALKPKIYEVYYLKYIFNTDEVEIDAVVQYRDTKEFTSKYILIEVKSGDKPANEYAKHLVSKTIPKIILDNTTKRIVIYSGKTLIKQVSNQDIYYINMIDFLSDPVTHLELGGGSN